jgi:hypothetical protein
MDHVISNAAYAKSTETQKLTKDRPKIGAKKGPKSTLKGEKSNARLLKNEPLTNR